MKKELENKGLNNFIIFHYFWKYEDCLKKWNNLSEDEKNKWVEYKFKE